jgi:L-threonylcarbamoyladenylate synthase
LTIVLPKKKFISDLITASLPTVGIRCPNHPMALGLIEKLGIPLAAPSANLFKKTSPTSAAHVRDIFSTDDVYVMEGGDCQIGIESTIVFIAENAENAEKNSWSVLRPGIITVSELTKVLKKKPQEDTLNSAHQVLAPGQMIDHYQPDKPLYLKNSNDTLEHFCQMHGIQSPIIINLPNDPLITARVLYSEWRKAVSRPGDALICSLPSNWQSDERWLAIWDRIKKASKKS